MVWQTLLEQGVRPKRDQSGDLPLNDKLMETLQSYRVSFCLLPLASKPGSSGSTGDNKKPKNTQGGKGGPTTVQKPWVKSWNKGGGKKGTKGKPRVPYHIFKAGGTAANPSGEAICFAYNSTGGCADAPDGAKCRRGHHICAKCYNSHPIQQHADAP